MIDYVLCVSLYIAARLNNTLSTPQAKQMILLPDSTCHEVSEFFEACECKSFIFSSFPSIF